MKKVVGQKWSGIVLVLLGVISTIIGWIPAVFVYPGKGMSSSEYWSFVLLKAPERWLWQIGILVVVAGIIMVNQSVKKTKS
ncbi:hypothetical protein [Staphylospora marina]|uniref:hypothetical protein n=1 Tax=Staphylospora marina TaxID=2490858 RepID=UPI000F5BF394|nr:hypothetical protein [Staphylospora marina]